MLKGATRAGLFDRKFYSDFKKFLNIEYGVSPNKLIAAGKSKFDPLVSNDTPEAMAKNRRVEFIIIPNRTSLESEIED